MTRNLRVSTVFAALVLLAVSSFGQTTYGTGDRVVGTVIDVDEGRGRLQIETDDGARATVEADSVSTTYHGFGTMIAGKPEIFTGSKGLSNVRLSDRVEIRGSSRTEGVVTATRVTLIGRQVAANSTGVGQTRTPTSVSTAIDNRPDTAQAQVTGTIEGTVRQINLEEGRVIIQTPQRRMVTIRTYRSTPVWYRGQQYQVTNLEIGDRIRVEPDSRGTQGDEITARRIDVIQSVQEGGNADRGGVATVLEGRVTRVEPGLDHVYIDDGRGEVRVDMSQAEDSRGDRIRATGVRVGDRVEITGTFNRVGDMFMASTVRYPSGSDIGVGPVDDFVSYSVVTLTATITETLEDEATIGLRVTGSNQVVRLYVTEDFIVRMKGTTTTTAGSLKVNDSVLIKAFRDRAGNLIAQTIRLRNR